MIEQPKCCGTCKHLQDRTNYCHKKKGTRYNLLGAVNCDQWAKSWRAGWRSDVGPVVVRAYIKVAKKVDLLDWTGVR